MYVGLSVAEISEIKHVYQEDCCDLSYGFCNALILLKFVNKICCAYFNAKNP